MSLIEMFKVLDSSFSNKNQINKFEFMRRIKVIIHIFYCLNNYFLIIYLAF
jgi:hypothetical protein